MAWHVEIGSPAVIQTPGSELRIVHYARTTDGRRPTEPVRSPDRAITNSRVLHFISWL